MTIILFKLTKLARFQSFIFVEQNIEKISENNRNFVSDKTELFR